jgi:predicted  nucleic acid-binding Zn-ribbon protein
MIEYICANCGEVVETDAEPGMQEGCPACRHINMIPQPAPSMAEAQARADAEVGAQVAELRQQHAAEQAPHAVSASAQANANTATPPLQEAPPSPLRRPRQESVAEKVVKSDGEHRAPKRPAPLRTPGTGPTIAVAGLAIGISLILAGIITVGVCLAMDVSVETSHWYDELIQSRRFEVADLGKINEKMNQRLFGVVIGVGLFLSGTIVFCLSGIYGSLWKIAGNLQRRLSDRGPQANAVPVTAPGRK